MVVRDQSFLVKFHGHRPEVGPVDWHALTVIAQDETGRVVPGDDFMGSSHHQVAGLSDSGGSPDEAFLRLEAKLIGMKSVES